ncbi:MAG TPA: E2 ligase fold family C protein [Terriglobales bacterium]|nr:E2 ligase fold family C protein [Terriglobales bacterium]
MALAPFFDRIYSALGGHLSVSRDDLETALRGVVVGIRVASRLSQNDVWIAELTANLIARLYPTIAISGPEQHATKLKSVAQAINPAIEIVSGSHPDLTIAVGPVHGGAALRPSASGWVARLNHNNYLGSGPPNPYAAGAAATFATAEVFRRVFLAESQGSNFSVSLLNFDPSLGADRELSSSSLGDLLFVAVGAVGNAGLWALARDKKRTGRITLLDNERLELSNLQRYVLGTLDDANRNLEKVVIGQRELAESLFEVATTTGSLEEYAGEQQGIKHPNVCISVDNIPSRRASQALLPRLIVNGWTGEQALGASWHVLSREAACLACLYQPHGEGLSQTEQAARALGLTSDRAAMLWVTRLPLSDEDIASAAKKLGVSREDLTPWKGKSLGDLYTDVVCGAVPISLPVSRRVETVPLAHQSALAGILMAAELVKRTDPNLSAISQDEPLISWDNILRPPPDVWPKPRSRERGCICGDRDYQLIYRDKWEHKSHLDH